MGVSTPESPQLPSSPLAMSHSHTFTFPEAELKTRLEHKRKEAVWDLFQSESAFLRDHLMAIKNVTSIETIDGITFLCSRSSWSHLKRCRLKVM